MDTIALVPNNSLIRNTWEGQQLAVKLARLIIKLTQPDEEAQTATRCLW